MKRTLFVLGLLLFALPVHAALPPMPIDCLITWSPNPLVEEVTHYIAEVEGAGVTTQVQVPFSDLEVRCSEFVPPITPGSGQYTAHVHAINQWGMSDASERIDFGVCPGSPLGVTIIAEPGDCLISWTPGAQDLDFGVTHYMVIVDNATIHAEAQVEAEDLDIRCSEFTPPIDPSAGFYAVRIHAVNQWGDSESSDSVTFGAVPSKPMGLTVIMD